MTTTVVDWRTSKDAVYIGRSRKGEPINPFGTPFFLKDEDDDQERETVVRKYWDWIQGRFVPMNPESPYLQLNLADLLIRIPQQLKGRQLGCYCAPRRCHGDVLAYLADNDDARNRIIEHLLSLEYRRSRSQQQADKQVTVLQHPLEAL